MRTFSIVKTPTSAAGNGLENVSLLSAYAHLRSRATHSVNRCGEAISRSVCLLFNMLRDGYFLGKTAYRR
jgi:hypothetical protein